MAAWFKTSRKDRFWRRLFDKAYDKGYALGMGGDYRGKSWQGELCLEINAHWNNSGVPVADGKWHHVVGTFDGSEQRIYLDGQPVGKPTRWKGAPARNTFDLSIGLARSTPDEGAGFGKASFDGLIDEAMVFNRALSATEIAALYESQK